MMGVFTEMTWKGDEELITETTQDPNATPRERELAARLAAARDKVEKLKAA